MEYIMISGGVCILLLLIIAALSVKIYLMRKSAGEITRALAEKLSEETNTILDISSRDSAMCQMTGSLNVQLRRLRQKRQRFQQGDEEMKEAITNISHDLRTPLTAIRGYLELLRQEELSENGKRYVEVIEERTGILQRLTEELFGFSLAASTLESISLEPVVLNRVLEESISAYYEALKSRGITPEIRMPQEPQERLLNKNALSRIFGNIISNAIKYSDGDLRIVLEKNGELMFCNHASGLDGVQVQKLLNRFYTVKNAGGSTGLGLSIARTLTGQLNGTISVEYDEGELKICVWFP